MGYLHDWQMNCLQSENYKIILHMYKGIDMIGICGPIAQKKAKNMKVTDTAEI